MVDKQQTKNLGGITGKGWLPGQSGNPKGRPPDKKYITEALKDLLANNPVLLEAVVEAIIKEAKNGNIQAFKEITDRTEGKVADKLDLKGEILITPDMRALAAREMLEIKEEESKLLNEAL